MEADKLLEIETQLTCTLIVPEFNIENIDLTQDDFKEFHHSLLVNLPIVFDVLHKNEELFLEPTKDNLKFRINLTLILCEQTCTNKFFHVKNDALKKHISHFIQNYAPQHLFSNDEFICEMFEIYKKKLKSESWKRNYSYIYSFGRFCELLALTQKSTITGKCMIILAIGTNLLESYEPEFKLMGIRLFHILLKYTDQSTINELNIHGVIFFTSLPNLNKIKETHILSCLLDCLYNCAILFNVTNFSVWNNIDDILSATFQKLSYESNSDISIKLLEFLNRMLTIKSPIDESMDYQKIRETSRKNCNYVNYRWVKSLLDLYISECQKHLGYENNAKLLRLLHVSYLLGIYSVPPELVFQQNKIFYRDFVKLLMVVLTQNIGQTEIVQEVRLFVETFIHHFNEMNPLSCKDAAPLKDDFNVLLQHDVFKFK